MGEELATARGLVTRVARPDGSTVIVKERDDAALSGFAATSLETERRALLLLADLDIAPQLIESTQTRLVLSDVGRSVESLLFGNDPHAAIEALVGLARVTAQLHAVPIGDELADLNTWTVTNCEKRLDLIESTIADLAFPAITDDVRSEHDALLAELRTPNALIHGDLVPNNAAVDAHGKVRLLDFEGCAFDHIGHDLAMLWFPFAWFGKWRSMPSSVLGEMTNAYGPASAQHIATGVVTMTWHRLERLPVIAQDNDSTFRRRNQIAWTIDRCLQLIVDDRRFEATAVWLEQVSAAVKKRWAEATAPSPGYPAFAS